MIGLQSLAMKNIIPISSSQQKAMQGTRFLAYNGKADTVIPTESAAASYKWYQD